MVKKKKTQKTGYIENMMCLIFLKKKALICHKSTKAYTRMIHFNFRIVFYLGDEGIRKFLYLKRSFFKAKGKNLKQI